MTEQAQAPQATGSRSQLAAIIDTRDLRRRFDEHRAGTRDHGYSLWAVWVLDRWLNAVQNRSSLGAAGRSTASQVQAAVASNA